MSETLTIVVDCIYIYFMNSFMKAFIAISVSVEINWTQNDQLSWDAVGSARSGIGGNSI